jgi:hypothetical protein
MIRGTGTSSSSSGTATRGIGTVTGGRSSGSAMSSSSGRTAAVMGYDNETSSSPTCMHFTLGTMSSSSLMCMMPNSSFIISNIIYKNMQIYPNSLILEREGSVFLKKRKDKELINWRGKTGPSRRRRRQRRRHDSLDEAMGRV